MTEITPLSDLEKAFLRPYLPKASTRDSRMSTPPDRPFVTLTYASSLDGQIALAPGTRTTLSGPETKSMTHYLRAHHEAILVGRGTAVADDPALNCRYPGVTFKRQPRPVVVDVGSKWKVEGSRVTRLAKATEGKAVWVLGTGAADDGDASEAEGFKRVQIGDEPGKQNATGGAPSLSWAAILSKLKQEGINSVMIEGGGTVIADLLACPELVDTVIVTIAPTWLGEGGVSIAPRRKHDADGVAANAARLKDTSWRQFGLDAVLCGILQR